MGRTGFRWLEAIVAVGIAAMAFTVILLLFPPLKSEVAAAWVQAIGSIAAIIAAFLIPMYQHRQAEKAADDERALNTIVLLKSIQHLVVAAETHLRLARDAFCCGDRGMLDNYFTTKYSKGDLADIAEAISQISLHSVPAEIFGMLPLKRVLTTVEEYLAYFATEQYTDANYRNMVERLRKDVTFVYEINRSISAAMFREGRRVRDRTRVIAIFKDDELVEPSEPKS